MKGSGWVPKALRNFQEKMFGVEEYFSIILETY